MERDAEAAYRLADSEGRFHAVADHSGVGIWQITPEGFTRYVNGAMCELLELDSPAELEGVTFHYFFTEASLSVIRGELAKRPAGIPSSYEVRLVGKHGTQRDVIIHGAPFFSGPQRQFDGMIATFTDITELKRNQEQLAALNRIQRRLVDVIQSLSRCRRSDDVVEVVRRAARDLTGADGITVVLREEGHCHYVAEDAIGPLWAGRRFPIETCISGWAMRHREPVVIEDIYQDSRIPLDVYEPTFVRSLLMVPVRRSDPVGALGAYWADRHRATQREHDALSALADATAVALENVRLYEDLDEARRAAEQRATERKEWQRRYEAAIEASSQVFYEWNSETDEVVWAGEIEQVLGLDRTEVGNQLAWWREQVHPEDRDLFDAETARVAHAKEPADVQYRMRRGDGEYATVHHQGRFFEDARGQLTRMVGFLSDMTKRDRLERQLQQAQRMEAIGRLAGGIAHDFNNLLVPILTYTETALDEVGTETDVGQDLSAVREAGKRAKSLTRQLLALSRKQSLEFTKLSLNDEVRALKSMLRRLIRENIELRLELSDVPDVHGDATQLNQILMNLAVNAQDAMPNGGSLTLTTDEVAVRDADLEDSSALAAGRYVRLRVSDTGHGMDEETRRRIFEPFFTTKEPGYGTGLGLATILGIAHQHGGEVRCASQPGQGTTFEVLLPRADRSSQQPVQSESEAASGGSETILVAEGEPVVRNLAQRVLADAGYKVLAAGDPSSALELSDGHDGPIHLLLTDVVLPGGDGTQLYERVTARRPGIGVLFVSGHTPERAQACNQASLTGRLLYKPFGMRELLGTIRSVLGSTSPVRTSSSAPPAS